MTMDVYSRLMESVNQKAGSRLGRTLLGKEDIHVDNGSEMGADEIL